LARPISLATTTVIKCLITFTPGYENERVCERAQGKERERDVKGRERAKRERERKS
jgi:hypothetical protein